jgi:hypothetical protein
MGYDYSALFLFGIKFSFQELEHLKTNPLVVKNPGDNFEVSLSDFWYGEFEGVDLVRGSPDSPVGLENDDFYAASAEQSNYAYVSKEEFMYVLNDEEFIEKLKRFCKNFGLEYQEPVIHSVLHVF